MVKLWAMRVKLGLSTIDDVPERYKDTVKIELNIE